MDAFICKQLLDEFLEDKEITTDVVSAVEFLVDYKDIDTKVLYSQEKYKKIAKSFEKYKFITLF